MSGIRNIVVCGVVLGGLVTVSRPALAQRAPLGAETRMKSPPLVAGGVGVLLLGLGTGVGAGFLTFFASTQHSCASYGCDPPPYSLLGAAIPLQVVALSGIVGGIVMMAVGAHQVSVDKIAVGPGGLRVRW